MMTIMIMIKWMKAMIMMIPKTIVRKWMMKRKRGRKMKMMIKEILKIIMRKRILKRSRTRRWRRRIKIRRR